MKWAALVFLLFQETVVVEVGRSAELHLPFKPMITICDDTSIVKVEDIGDALRLTGLKPGQTDCGFRKVAELPATMVHVVVVKPETKPKKK